MSATRDMIMFKLGSMSDQELLKGFAASGAMDAQGGGALDGLSLDGEDPENMVKSWGDLKIEKVAKLLVFALCPVAVSRGFIA